MAMRASILYNMPLSMTTRADFLRLHHPKHRAMSPQYNTCAVTFCTRLWMGALCSSTSITLLARNIFLDLKFFGRSFSDFL